MKLTLILLMLSIPFIALSAQNNTIPKQMKGIVISGTDVYTDSYYEKSHIVIELHNQCVLIAGSE